MLQRLIGFSITLLFTGVIVSLIARFTQYLIGAVSVRRGEKAGAPRRRRTTAAARPSTAKATRELQPRRRVRAKTVRVTPSVQRPSPAVVQADRVINELYGDNPNRRISKNRIVDAVSAASIDPEVSSFFSRVPEGSYRRQELIDALNTQVRRRRRVKAMGLFGTGPAEEEAQRQLQEKVA
ncbi:MAG: hypothetical protein ACOX87_01715 [Chloroflexota bacterium]